MRSINFDRARKWAEEDAREYVFQFSNGYEVYNNLNNLGCPSEALLEWMGSSVLKHITDSEYPKNHIATEDEWYDLIYPWLEEYDRHFIDVVQNLIHRDISNPSENYL